MLAVRIARAVDLMYTSGGASALRTSNPLQRLLRDANAVKQHVDVGFGWNETAGASVLGSPG